MSRTPARKVSLSLEFRAQSWSLVQVSSQAGAQSAETFADFVDQVGTSPETFLKSDDTEAGPRTYLPGSPKSRRQASQIGGGAAKSGP